jgi:hypothetical protein
MSYAAGKFMMISSSYGRYGFVEFLSNEIGYPIPFYIERGKEPTYGLNKLILRNITQESKFGKPKNVLWIMTESEIFKLSEGVPMSLVVDIKKLRTVSFDIIPDNNETLSGSILRHKTGVLKFVIKTKEKITNFTIAMKVKSTSRISNLKYISSDGSFSERDLVQDGEISYIKFQNETPSSRFTFEITTPREVNIKGKHRRFSILGFYK